MNLKAINATLDLALAATTDEEAVATIRAIERDVLAQRHRKVHETIVGRIVGWFEQRVGDSYYEQGTNGVEFTAPPQIVPESDAIVDEICFDGLESGELCRFRIGKLWYVVRFDVQPATSAEVT